MASENIIQEHWENKSLLGMNCILFADGSVTVLNFYTVTDGKEKQYYVNPVCDTTLESIEKYNSDPWTEIEIHPDTLKLNNGDMICYGEGGMGNEGFVALQDNEGRLKWAFFSTELNPFIKAVSKDQNTILAYSTYDLVVSINILAPETMKISRVG